MMEPGPLRDEMTANIYLSSNEKLGLARLEKAFGLDCVSAPALEKVKRAQRKKELPKLAPLDLFSLAQEKTIVSAEEAEEYFQYLVHENGDWATADYWESVIGGSQSIPAEALPMLRERVISGQSILLLKGNPDEVADQFKQLSDAGLDGMAFGLANFIDDLPIIRDEVMPLRAVQRVLR